MSSKSSFLTLICKSFAAAFKGTRDFLIFNSGGMYITPNTINKTKRRTLNIPK